MSAREVMAELDAHAEGLLMVSAKDAHGDTIMLPLPGPTPRTQEQFAALVYLASRRRAVSGDAATRYGIYLVRLQHLRIDLLEEQPGQRLGAAIGCARLMGADLDLERKVADLGRRIWKDAGASAILARRILLEKWKSYVERQRVRREHSNVWGGFIRKHLPKHLIPYPHQEEAGQFLREAHHQGIVADEQGLGKTIEALLAILDAHVIGKRAFPALIVCPSTVHETWIQAAELWLQTLNIRTAAATKDTDLTGYELGFLRTKLRGIEGRIRKGQLKNPAAIARQIGLLRDTLPPAQLDLLVADEKRPTGWRLDEHLVEAYLQRPLVVVSTPSTVLRSNQALQTVSWGSIILDEFEQFLINHKSATCQQLTILSRRASVRLGLSGTPLPNGRPIGLYSILRLTRKLPRDHLKFESYGRTFCKKGTGRKFVGRKTVWDPKLKKTISKTVTAPDFSGRSNPVEFAQHMRNVQLRRTKREVFQHGELPPKTRQGVHLKLDWSHRLKLAQAEDACRFRIAERAADLRSELQAKATAFKEALIEKHQAVPDEAIEGQLRSNGLSENQIESRVQKTLTAETAILIQELRVTLGLIKVDLSLPYILEQIAAGERPLVFCAHTVVAERLLDELKAALGSDTDVLFGSGKVPRAQRKPLETKWNDGCGKVWVCTQAFSAGMTALGGRQVIFVERFWDPKIELQAEDRCHRIGQTRPCFAVYTHVRGTVDDHMVQLGAWKEVGMEGLQGNPNTRVLEWILERGGAA